MSPPDVTNEANHVTSDTFQEKLHFGDYERLRDEMEDDDQLQFRTSNLNQVTLKLSCLTSNIFIISTRN